MGWEQGGYVPFVEQKGVVSNKITKKQKSFNDLSVFEIAEAIKRVQYELTKENKDISKVDLKSGNLDIPYMKYAKDEEKEYIIPEVGVDVSKMNLEDEKTDISKSNDIAYVKIQPNNTKSEDKNKDLGDER